MSACHAGSSRRSFSEDGNLVKAGWAFFERDFEIDDEYDDEDDDGAPHT
jgi:hypothetical protein